MLPQLPMVILWWSTLFLMSILIFIRLWLITGFKTYAPGLKSLNFSIQDFLLSLIWVFVFSMSIMGTNLAVLAQQLTQYGRGSPASSMNTTVEDISKNAYILYITNLVLLWLTKLPLLQIYLETKTYQPKSVRILTIGTGLFHLVSFGSLLLAYLFGCGMNVEENWKLESHCTTLSSIPLVSMLTGFSVFTDLLLIAIGILVLFSFKSTALTRTSRTEFSAMAFVFLIGTISITASLARLVSLFGNNVRNVTEDNFSFWFSIETIAALVACVLPTFRGLLRRIRGMICPLKLEEEGLGLERSASSLSGLSSDNSSTNGLEPVR